MKTQGKDIAIWKPKREVSEETNHADTLISDLQRPELRENKFLLFELSSLWYFVMVALTD